MHTHAERRILPYTPAQLYDLVADIEKYPQFLPWCLGARIRERRDDLVIAEMIIGYRVFRERFVSRVKLSPLAPDGPRIDVEYSEGPFKYLVNHWRFLPAAQGCEIDFFVEFEFHSRLLEKALELLFHEAVRRMVLAFERRALVLYGGGGCSKPQ